MAKPPTNTKGPRQYYSVRTGKNPHARGLDLPMFKTLWYSVYETYRAKEYFEGAFGKDCVDGEGGDGEIGPDVPGYLLRQMRKQDVWPIDKYLADYKEDDVFDMTEFLFDCASVPSGGSLHSYNGCGYHHDTFDKEAGQKEFREEMNKILRDYQTGYELSGAGEVLALADEGLQGVMDAPFLASTDKTNVTDRVQAAIRKYRHHNSPLSDRREAVRELADVLEWLRPEVQKVLTKKDENALFHVANQFAIRHHSQNQHGDYDPNIWCSWMFYFFLSSIHASVRLIEREKQNKEKK